MSLIVQVNNGGPPAGSTTASPVASAAVTVSANILAPSPPTGPTDFSIARQLPQQPQPMLKKSPLPPAAPTGPLPGNLSRVMAHQQSRLTLTTLPEQHHVVQQHPPPLRMIQMSPHAHAAVALPQSPLRPGSLLTATGVHSMRSPTRMMQMQAPPQLPQTPIGQRQLQQAGLVAASGRPTRPVMAGATVVRMPTMPPVSGVLTTAGGPPPGLLHSHGALLPAHFTLRHGGNSGGRLPQPPSNLQPLPPATVGFRSRHPQPPHAHTHAHSTPPHHLQPLPASLLSPPLAQSSTAPSRIFPPNAFPQQFYSPRRRSDSNDELDLSDPHDGMHLQQQHPLPLHRTAGRSPAGPSGFPMARGRATNMGRMPMQPPALQDHNYASRPPPTPPPPVQSPPPTTLSSTVLPDGFASFAAFGEHQLSLQQQPVAPSAAAVAAAAALGMASPVSGLASSSPSLPPTVNALDSPLNMTMSVSSKPFTREQQQQQSIEDAGVGPMAPLTSADDLDEDDEDVYRRSPVRRGPTSANDNEEGEETETAPEEQDEEDDEQEDSITRCICDFLHDDGYMICCDGCSVWQHVVCMGLDKNNIPEKYLCEVCKPRPVDRKRARAMQARRRSEIFKRDSSSDDSDEDHLRNRTKKLGAVTKKMLDRSRSTDKLKKIGPPGSATKNGKGKGISLLTEKANRLIRDKKNVTKISWKKKSAAERGSGEGKKLPTPKSKLSVVARRKSVANSDDDDDSVEEDGASDSESALAPKLDASQHLRSWIDQYEEAVTNHYSPELRARLMGNKMSSIAGDLRSSAIGGPVKCNVSLKGNGVKILTANTSLSANTPVIECKGKLMLASQFRAQQRAKASSGAPPPHVFFYPLSDAFEICLDGKTYGNDSRFCRRSTNANAELRHVVDKGSLHLFIVTSRPVDKNQEIVLPLDRYDEKAATSPLQSISADLREIKKPNGLVDDQPLLEKKKKSDTPKRAFTKINKERPKKPRVKIEESIEAVALASPKAEVTSDHELSVTVNGDADGRVPLSPTKFKPSPGKLGLPDNSGLIVGVNTINYDADSSVRNKAKSREERKMEMILRQFEAMEKAEQRKRDHPDTPGSGGGVSDGGGLVSTKRRRSSSAKTTGRSNSLVDSAVEASSAEDEARPEPKRSLKKKGKKGTPQRKRSRVMSGESVSAASEGEIVPPSSAEYSSATPNTAASASNGPFRFPKTKKSLMSDWLHESEAGRDGDDDDDDVSGSYLRGSRSPPGIATHLLRSNAASHSPTKTVSAKKRWLRQAISEDHSEDVANTNGSGSPGEVCSDYVTPLKKRRLANFKEDQEQEQEVHDEMVAGHSSVPTPSEVKYPSSLKKKLLNNMVLEEVLDKAMEDMGGSPSTSYLTTTVLTSSLETAVVPKRNEESKPFLTEAKPIVEEPKPVKLGESLSEMGERELSCAVKTPEPSSVFRSYFKSDVSLEELEAQLEATKRQRDLTVGTEQQYGGAVKTEQFEQPPVERSLSKEELPVDEEVCDMKTVEVADVKAPVETNAASGSQAAMPEVVSSPKREPQPESASAKEKRKVSLADYRKRRRHEDRPESSRSASASAAAIEAESSENTSAAASVEEPGTPTLDEQVGDLPPIPMLNPLPLFEKLEKLEQAHKENNQRKAQNATELEPKREDLTERLKKTFGLAVEDEDAPSSVPVLAHAKEPISDSIRRSKSREFSPHPPPGLAPSLAPAPPSRRHDQPPPQQQQQPPPSSSSQSHAPHQQQPPPAMMPAYPSSSSSGGHRYGYTPTQYPSYPNNYPVPPYPKSSSSSAAPPPSASASSSSYSSSAVPPPHPTSSRSVSEDGHSGGNSSSSSRRGGEYYSHRSSSSSGYYPESRKSDRGDRRDRDARDHRDRDYHRDKDYREYHHHYRGSGGGGGGSGGSGGRKHSSSFHSRGGYYS